MATILTMEFPSSDEEDENYDVEEDLKKELEEELEEGLEEGLEENKKKRKRNERSGKKIEKAIKSSIIKEKIEKTYNDINEEFEKLYTHETNINKEDFLLQFHKKYPQLEKNYNTTQKLLNHLNKYCSIEDDNSNTMNVREYKQKCRNNNNKDVSNVVKNALESFYDNNSVDIEKKYMYAGKIYTVKKKIDKTSSSYKRYLKTQEKMNIGGNFANIDELIQNIQESKQINTVDKSTEDWKNYKIVNSIDEEKLKANQNYLENKLFAENVERKLFESKIKKKAT
ncbi:conserved Plasmodium protein, unknown function [Plasmodium ovale]|uniref:BCNT-C domain-containing protein n=2 Tax=Plasmodium ovale TaxID=36330 RepID=A0A1A8VVY0_PLAOA|nr:hypothetical protein, conserved [Plasmodium ovale curtisi]SBS93237.1 hypothetical protein, conserved [Plasmodium ovale curtisi]SCQ16606.1 conserved Plasmodium protein, unknown function [Plasmodium ovale]